MSASILETVESIHISSEFKVQMQKHAVSKADIEEMLFNFPVVKKITVQFSDGYQRFYAQGKTDTGKSFGMIFFIQNTKIIPTTLLEV